MKIGIFVALPREARAIFGSNGWLEKKGIFLKKIIKNTLEIEITVCGQGKKGAQKAFFYFEQKKIKKIINLGVAGALEETLTQGELILPNLLISNEGKIASLKESKKIENILKSHTYPFKICNLFTSKEAVSSPFEKRQIHTKYGACAVDMEAFYIGRLCKNSSLTFYSIKAISDSLDHLLPKEVLNCLDDMGGMNYARLFKNVVLKPALIKHLIILGRGFDIATKRLKGVTELIIPLMEHIL